MNLQFKPEMYLDNGQPAGYDVDLLKKLVPDLGVALNIQNLDFNGLIPGLQSKKFDMVSVGLSATPERKKVVDFTRAYVPYALVLGVPTKDASSITSVDAVNASGKTVTALQGSTGEQLAKKLFPKAKVKGFPDQNAAFLEVATGRADAIVVEDYLLAQFQASNAGKLEKAAIAKPLDVQYGSWAVPKGNDDFVKYLDTWLCKAQTDGTLEELYKKDFSVDEFPPMPDC
jgi:ABC-type amino acid transport substrate-binding protein